MKHVFIKYCICVNCSVCCGWNLVVAAGNSHRGKEIGLCLCLFHKRWLSLTTCSIHIKFLLLNRVERSLSLKRGVGITLWAGLQSCRVSKPEIPVRNLRGSVPCFLPTVVPPSLAWWSKLTRTDDKLGFIQKSMSSVVAGCDKLWFREIVLTGRPIVILVLPFYSYLIFGSIRVFVFKPRGSELYNSYLNIQLKYAPKYPNENVQSLSFWRDVVASSTCQLNLKCLTVHP